ncbi:hypothetical protein QLX67_07295 [Balneolaceae bacterium ANBcel3]|nr:hypothetical protein [Balneolaceae bacterium ANBcel3]
MAKITLLLFSVLIAVSAASSQPFGYTPLQVQSLFSEEYRNEQYEQALLYGRWLVEAHPKEMEEYPGNFRGDRNFSRMIDIYEYIAEEQDDPSLREAYLDSSIQMYDRVLALFTEDEIDLYRWHFNRGRFFQKHAEYLESGFQRALQDYETMFELDPERATKSGSGYYVHLLVQNYARQNNREAAFAIMNRAQDYADESTLEFFAKTRNDLITDPHERIEMLSEDLEEDPGNMDILQELYELYQATGNRDKSREVANKMYNAEPSLDNILRLADKTENDGNYIEANRYLSEAHELQDGRDKARSSLRIANNFLRLRNLQNARLYAQRAAREDTSWGEPFITIAQIYGETISRCAGSEMTRIDRAVYWLVLDYLDRARQRNSGVTNTVNRLYRTYEPVTPSAEDKFYQNWTTGEKLKVDGSLRECYSWINEETTIR